MLSRAEVAAILGELRGTHRLVASLLYGSGLRLLEALTLRVKDVELTRYEVTVRGGKGGKDRVTPLPAALDDDLVRHVRTVRERHEADLAHGAGWVELPHALAAKSPGAARQLAWQWVFPAARCHTESQCGRCSGSLSHDGRSCRSHACVAGSASVAPGGGGGGGAYAWPTHVLNRGGRVVRSPLDTLHRLR